MEASLEARRPSISSQFFGDTMGMDPNWSLHGWDSGLSSMLNLGSADSDALLGFETLLSSKAMQLDDLLDPFASTHTEMQIDMQVKACFYPPSSSTQTKAPSTPSITTPPSDSDRHDTPLKVPLDRADGVFEERYASRDQGQGLPFGYVWTPPSQQSALLWNTLENASNSPIRGATNLASSGGGIMSQTTVWPETNGATLHEMVSQTMTSAQAPPIMPHHAASIPDLDSAFAQTNEPLASWPCLLPRRPSDALNGEVRHDPLASVDSERLLKLYSLAPLPASPQLMPDVVTPMASKALVEQNALEKVSLAASAGIVSANEQSIGVKRKMTIVAGLPALNNKGLGADRQYECPTCHKTFERAYNRKMHMATHEAIENRLKPFVCPVPGCGKKFARKHDKNRHHLGVHLRARKVNGCASPSAPSVAYPVAE